MKAAVLDRLGEVPRYGEFAEPELVAGEKLVRVRAASLKQIDRGLASGRHYMKPGVLPCVCGIDGVGELQDGRRVYFGGCRQPYGTMAELAPVNPAWMVPVPEGLDDVSAAALPNPALSSWLPLLWRVKLQPGQSVLILGATGASGQLAIQVAKHLGAGRVIAAGRDRTKLDTLTALGADALIPLDLPAEELQAAFAAEARQGGFDIVLDYVWGPPTEALIAGLSGHDLGAEPHITRLIQIGSMAGDEIRLPAQVLRSTGLEIYGSGGGSVPHSVIREVFPNMLQLALEGGLRLETVTVPLAEVAAVWERDDAQGRRVVLQP